jgi:nucleoside-diphosphate-sugar epimerase
MKVLVTGHHGYIGSVLVDVIARAGHDVVGLDTNLFEGADFGPERLSVDGVRKDVRDVEIGDLAGFEAVIHLAALSNDPLGHLDEANTYDINHLASVRLARLAKASGVERFLFASSCSLYGVAGDTMLTEEAAFNPITAYGRSKVLVEQDLTRLADDSFSPTYLRNATAYGVSPRLRADVVVNNLVAAAHTTGEVTIQSDGTPWRPLVHIEDISRAFLAVLEAPRALVHDQAFNVGSSAENYQVRDIADIVERVVPGCRIKYMEGGGPDPRCYRVNCDKIARTLSFQTQWTVARGVEELYAAAIANGLTAETLQGFFRLNTIRRLMQAGGLDASLKWAQPATTL